MPKLSAQERKRRADDALNARIDEYAKRVVAGFRPLTQAEKDHLAELLAVDR